jgi:photosystem II stability/assembly factor-like uncharacterized protein
MKQTTILHITFCLLLLITKVGAQTIVQVPSQANGAVSIRGLSVVDDKVAWISGAKGTIGITRNGGLNWSWHQIKGFEKSDFRDVEAFSAKTAIIIASGYPAYILKTTDGGIHWETKFQKADSSYFLDAMDFVDKRHGFVLGDPIAGKFLLLETTDGGDTWRHSVNPPAALKGEAAFAASGTCMRINKLITIVTGGSHSRMLLSPIKKMMWVDRALPLTGGGASSGAFSLAYGNDQIIVVGGNYAKDKQTDSVAYLIPEQKATYKKNIPIIGPAGYQSCIEYLSNEVFISTGTSGSNITKDAGKTWYKFDNASYNVCRKAKLGNLVLLAGDKGKIGIFKF